MRTTKELKNLFTDRVTGAEDEEGEGGPGDQVIEHCQQTAPDSSGHFLSQKIEIIRCYLRIKTSPDCSKGLKEADYSVKASTRVAGF